MFRIGFLILLLHTSLSVLPGIYNTYDSRKLCDDIEVTKEITDENGIKTITLSVKNAQNPIYYFFHDKDGNVISSNYKSGKVRNIKSGDYFCVIFDKTGCKITYNFTIEL